MPYISVGKENSGEIDLYYEDHGEGTPVVLIHGWPLSGDAWEKQVPALLGAGYRVITYDRRGFGRSSKPVKGYDFDTFAQDLDKLMTALNLNDVTLVGFSMGGGEVARYLGTIGSRRVSKAVFISAIPPYLIKTKDNPAGIDGSVFEGIKKGIVADRPSFLTQFFHNFYNADILKGKLISEEVMKLSWNTDCRRFTHWYIRLRYGMADGFSEGSFKDHDPCSRCPRQCRSYMPPGIYGKTYA